MENKNLKEKIIKNVRNRVVVSNLESEESMKLSKKKQILSLTAVMLVMLTGSFITVNAATDGEVVNKVKDTIKVILVKEDGKKEQVKGTSYIDSNNHAIEKYEINEKGMEHILEVDKTNLNENNLVITDTIKDNGASIVIQNVD